MLSLSPTNARSSSLLFLQIPSSHSSIPLAFMFAFIPTSLSLLLGELHTVSLLLCMSPSALSFFLLTSFYSPVWLCLPLAHPPLLPWIHAFHVGTLLSIHRSSELRCAYLAVWAFVPWVEVNGQEGEQEDKSEQTGSYDLRCSSQFPLIRSFFLSPPFSLRLSIMTSSLCRHASPCILVSKERERGECGMESRS